jgi:uncharacterized NAD(P)/FAD-binding protein YdhS
MTSTKFLGMLFSLAMLIACIFAPGSSEARHARALRQYFPLAVNIGLDVNEKYALIGASSLCSNRVLAIGPLARAAFWECIAIPDIRLQCRRLAHLIDAMVSGST